MNTRLAPSWMLGVKEEIGPMQQEANVSIARGSGPELPVWVAKI
jgi:hypothetical protein